MGPGGTTIYLASATSVGSGHFLGLGASSALFERNNVVIPVDAIITGIVLNVRDAALGDDDTVTATVYTSPCGFGEPIQTNLYAMVEGPSSEADPHCCATGFESVAVDQCTLLSVEIVTSTGNALNGGAAVTVFLSIP
ncbi:hypothetical protein ACS3UN_01050 [Oscillospiraceae bacterium LTW-04]|nr:hypothetical protein RBH76_09395 [Oscillospiraceae bacterium MB24-C1]